MFCQRWTGILLLTLFAPSVACATNGAPPTTAPSDDKALRWVRFIDRNNGWARMGNELLRTQNGGKSWRRARRVGGGECDFDVGLSSRTDIVAIISSDTVLVAYPIDDNKMLFGRSRDGGVHWSDWLVKFPAIALNQQSIQQSSVSFVDEAHGWLMLVPDHGMNSSPGFLYETQDGGKTWSVVSTTADRLPRGGAIMFRDAATGWLIGSETTTSPGSLYVTHNAGMTWHLQRLRPPNGLHDEDVEPLALPIFFGAAKRDGVLSCYGLAYTTGDGGEHWQPTTPRKDGVLTTFVSPSVGWIWTCSYAESGKPTKQQLLKTIDGGKTWQPLPLDEGLRDALGNDQQLIQLDFVDRDTGWALVDDPDRRENTLLETTDGGRNWTLAYRADR